MRRAINSAAALAAIVMTGSASADILIAASANQTWAAEVRATILATGKIQGHNIDLFDLTTGLPNLSNYDAVLTYTDGTPSDPTGWGNMLADFADAGGGVVQNTFAFSIGAAGRWFTSGYNPLVIGTQSQGTPLTLGTVHQGGHPVMNNVANFSGGTSSYHNTGAVNTNGILIAEWSNGRPLVVEMPGFNGRIIGLNFYAPSTQSRGDFWVFGTDGDQLMANALNYVLEIPAPGALALLGAAGLVSRRRRRSA